MSVTVVAEGDLFTFFAAMRTTSEVEAFFRLKRGTATLAARAGLLPSALRSRGGYDTYLIDPRDAYRYWGPNAQR